MAVAVADVVGVGVVAGLESVIAVVVMGMYVYFKGGALQSERPLWIIGFSNIRHIFKISHRL